MRVDAFAFGSLVHSHSHPSNMQSCLIVFMATRRAWGRVCRVRGRSERVPLLSRCHTSGACSPVHGASVTHIAANAIVSASSCALFVIDIDHSVAIHVEGSGAVLLGAPLRGGGVSAAACGPAASLFSCCCLPAAWLLLRFGAPQLE